MNQKWRLPIFFVFTAAFLITAPLVVLYTAGYRYQFGSTRIVKTGIVSVSTFPKNADIFLDDKEQSKRTPYVIKNLYPGEMRVRIEKEDYHPWDKLLSVGSGETTFLKDVVLFLESNVERYFKKTNISAVSQKDTSDFAYSLKNGLFQEVWITDGIFGSERLLAKMRNNNNASYSLSWSQDREFLMLKETVGARHKYLLIQARSGDLIPFSISSQETASWDTGSGHLLFLRSGTRLKSVNVDSLKTTRLPFRANAVQSSKDRFTIVQSSSGRSIVSYIDKDDVASILAYLPLGDYRFLESAAGRILLEDVERRRIILLDEHNPQNPLLLNTEARFFAWNENKNAIAFSNGFDLNIFSLNSHKTETLTRFSEPITGIAWYPVGGVLFFSQSDRIVAIETDNRDQRNQLELLSEIKVKKIWFEKDGSKLYALGSKNNEPDTIYQKQLQK